MSYQIKQSKNKLEDVIELQLPKDMNAEEKEGLNELLDHLKKFDKKQ